MDTFDKKDLGTVDGFDLVAYKEGDYHSEIDDADCYDAVDIEAWDNNEWHYRVVVVKAFLDGIKLGEAALGGVEDGHSPGWVTAENPQGYVDAFGHTLGGEGCYDLPADAIEDARQNLASLVKAAGLAMPCQCCIDNGCECTREDSE